MDGQPARSAYLLAGRRGCGELICREMEDLKILTESVCCIAREAGYFLKEERKTSAGKRYGRNNPMIMSLM